MTTVERVTCDGCPATSESGWGDTGLCIDCQWRADPTLVCRLHFQTHEAGELCPACRVLMVDAAEQLGRD